MVSEADATQARHVKVILADLRHMQPSDFTYALSPTAINNPHPFGSGFSASALWSPPHRIPD